MSHDPSTARRPGTLCVHGGRRASRPGDPVVTPLVPSTNFRLDDRAYEVRRAGRTQDALIYARETNPTVEAAEARIAALEGAEKALLFASGTAALHAACLAELSSGDHVVAARDLYGGSLSMFGELLPRLGVEVTWVDVGDRGAIEAAIGERTRWVYCESISNPALAVADVPALAAAAHRAGARLVVDATFATPIVQRPLALGADLVMHSASKYLGGHNDLVAGVL